MHHFLLIYDIERGQLLGEPVVFDRADEAVDSYVQAESNFRDRRDLQVILVASDSLETVKATHGNFFKRESIADFIDDLLRPDCLVQ